MPELNSSPSPDWGGLEAALGSLRPTPPTIDRDQLMYEAGRAARPQHRGLQSLALIACAAIALGLGRWTAPTTVSPAPTQLAENVVPQARDATESAFADPASYFQLRRHLGDADFAAIDTSSSPSAKAKTADRAALLHELLN